MLASELAPWNAEGIVALLHMQCTNSIRPSIRVSNLYKLVI